MMKNSRELSIVCYVRHIHTHVLDNFSDHGIYFRKHVNNVFRTKNSKLENLLKINSKPVSYWSVERRRESGWENWVEEKNKFAPKESWFYPVNANLSTFIIVINE